MEDNGSTKNNLSTEYTLSYELLFILEWIIEHEYETLKQIIEQAIESNGYHRIHELSKKNESTLEHEAQNSILEFLALLETAFVESVNEDSVKHLLQRNLLPAIDHIDIHQCDNTIVAACIAKATSKFEANPESNPQEILFKELLRRWKPKKTSNEIH